MNCHYGRIVALVEPVVAIGLLLILVEGFQDDTRCSTCKLLKIIALGVFFRVAKTTTLKRSNSLLLSDLQVTLAGAVCCRLMLC